MTQAAAKEDAVANGTYDVYIEIDIDCEELVDACGLDYDRTEHDDTQNEICLSLDEGEFEDLQSDANFNYTDEQDLGAMLLNYELGEYVTKVTIYKPNGNIVSFC